MVRTLTIFLLLFFPAICMYGQGISIRYPYRLYTTNDGLPKMQVTCLHQDREGYVWVGTKGGIARYDGTTFKTYNAPDGNIGGINNIFETANGNIIVLTNKGVRIIQDDTVSPVYTDNRYAFYFSHGWLIDQRLYCRTHSATEDNGKDKQLLICFDLRSKRFELTTEISFAIGELFPYRSDKALFFSTDSIGRNQYYQVISQEGISQKYVLPFRLLFSTKRTDFRNAALADRQGGIWTPADASDSVKFTRKLRLNTVPTDNFLFYEPEKNIAYITDHNNRLLRCSDETTDTLVRANIVWMQMKDRDGNMWIASEDGVYRFFGFVFREYYWNLNPGKPDFIWSMHQTADSLYWLNSGTEGLWKYDAAHQDKRLAYIKKDKVTSISTQLYYHPVIQDDAVYFPGGNIVLAATKKKITTYKTAAGLFLYKDPYTSNMLIAGRDIRYIAGDTVKTLYSEDEVGLNGTFILSMCRDKYNRLWYVGSGGIGCIAPGKKAIGIDPGPAGDFMSVLRDSKDNLWFAGSHGVWHYNYKTIRKLKHPALKQVGAIYEYQGKFLIISAVGKLAVVNLDSFYRNKETVNIYSAHNGYNGVDASQNSIFEDLEGYVWVNALNTVVRFFPDSLSQNIIAVPKISNTEVSRDNVVWQQLYGDRSLTYPFTNLRFSYSSIAFNHGGAVYYKTRLAGFSGWSHPTTETNAKFTNLPIRKKYVFEVMASADGVHWTKPSRTVAYYIGPAFYQTYVFYGCVASIVLGTAFFLIRKRNIARKAKLAREKELIYLRLQSIRKSMLPHLVLNTLTGIIHLAKTGRSAAAVKYIYFLSPLIRQVWLLSEKGHHSLKNELAFIRRYLKLQQFLYKAKFQYNIFISQDVATSLQVPVFVLHTFVENALKHGLLNRKDTGTLTISAQHTPDGILLAVTDDGVGRRQAAMSNKNSTKQGLQILSELIEKMNRDNKQKMAMEITDIYDEAGNSAGTNASILIPEKYKY